MEWKRYFSHYFLSVVNWWITITGNNGINHLPQIIILLLIFVSFYDKSRHFLPMKKLMIHKCLIQWDILYFHMSRNDVFWKISVPFSCIILIHDKKKHVFCCCPMSHHSLCCTFLKFKSIAMPFVDECL